MVEFQRRDYTPRSWKEDNAERMKHAFNMFGIMDERNPGYIQPDPEYDYLKQAQQYMNQANRFQNRAVNQRFQNSQINLANAPMGGVPNNRFGAFIQAIAGKESGGNYGAVNPDSGALGKYQIMPANIPSWSQEALGKQVSTQAFLNNPRLQEKIARYKLRQYFKQYGPAGAASAWYSGDPNKWKTSTHAQGNYPSIYNYVMAILQAMGIK